MYKIDLIDLKNLELRINSKINKSHTLELNETLIKLHIIFCFKINGNILKTISENVLQLHEIK